MNAQYLQIGNAVPILLGKAIATSFIEHDCIARKAKNWNADFDVMLDDAVTRLRSSARNKQRSAKAILT